MDSINFTRTAESDTNKQKGKQLLSETYFYDSGSLQSGN